MSNIAAVILAAGVGSRMGAGTTKQRLTVGGVSVLRRTLLSFEACEDIKSIVVVTREDEIPFVEGEAAGITKLYKIVLGGGVRAESAYNGFKAIPSDAEYVAIHDAARCLVTPDMISRVAKNAVKYGASTAACRVTDTVKIVDENGFVSSTPDRNFVYLASTPQIFSTLIYNRATENIDLSDGSITDDNMLLEKVGVSIYCTDVGSKNIKITMPGDIEYAEYILKEKKDEQF